MAGITEDTGQLLCLEGIAAYCLYQRSTSNSCCISGASWDFSWILCFLLKGYETGSDYWCRRTSSYDIETASRFYIAIFLVYSRCCVLLNFACENVLHVY